MAQNDRVAEADIMSSAFTIVRISEPEAEHIWQSSPQACVFNRPEVLRVLNDTVDWWAVFKGNQIQCIWPVVLDRDGKVTNVPFAYWVGPMWSALGASHPAHRALAMSTSVYQLFIPQFIERYGEIRASLHPSLCDVRVFDWWNYHEPTKPRFDIRPRYTAMLNLCSQQKEFQVGFRELRRRELRKFERIRDGFVSDSHVLPDELGLLYQQTLALGPDKMMKILSDFEKLLRLVDLGHGWVQAIRNKADGALAAVILVLNDAHQANMVLKLVDNQYRSNGLMARVTLLGIEDAHKRGLNVFDFNGANSPRRGDDKHSYGAWPTLYFDISYQES